MSDHASPRPPPRGEPSMPTPRASGRAAALATDSASSPFSGQPRSRSTDDQPSSPNTDEQPRSRNTDEQPPSPRPGRSAALDDTRRGNNISRINLDGYLSEEEDEADRDDELGDALRQLSGPEIRLFQTMLNRVQDRRRRRSNPSQPSTKRTRRDFDVLEEGLDESSGSGSDLGPRAKQVCTTQARTTRARTLSTVDGHAASPTPLATASQPRLVSFKGFGPALVGDGG
jgi:hypothetical protein